MARGVHLAAGPPRAERPAGRDHARPTDPPPLVGDVFTDLAPLLEAVPEGLVQVRHLHLGPRLLLAATTAERIGRAARRDACPISPCSPPGSPASARAWNTLPDRPATDPWARRPP